MAPRRAQPRSRVDSQIGGLHFRAIHRQKYYREQNYPHGSLTHTEWNSERICSLPLFPAMADSDIERVIDAILDIRK